MYDLRNYEVLYSLSDATVAEVKISPGIILVIHESKETVPLQILNIEDGTMLTVRPWVQTAHPCCAASGGVSWKRTASVIIR